MSDSVIVIMAYDSYLSHAKSLMVNCRRQGKWKGDFCLLTVKDCDTSDMEGRGISVMRAPAQRNHLLKFWIYSPHFHQWKRVLYLDCDIIVQGDLNVAVDAMAEKLPAIVCDGGMEPEGGTVLGNWEHFDNIRGPGVEAHAEVYEKMRSQYSHLDELVFTMDAIFFAPETIPLGTMEKLQAVAEEFREINPIETDQPTANLVLYDRMAPMTKDICTWFAFDEPANRVACPNRGWRGDEEPTILHYWGDFAPWLVKAKDAGAYFNYRLNRVCRELYVENLAAFDTVFPRST